MAAHDDLIAGRYQCLELIGRGSFGEVWRVWDRQRQEELALKILIQPQEGSADSGAAEQDRQRFWREARETWRFYGKHNIVLVFDYGEHRGRPFLVMQLMDGENLRDLLRRTGRLDPPRAVAILKQVATALGEAHRSKLVHRDVKPANIFVEAGDRVTLLDFGMLGRLDEGRVRQITASGTFGGTFEYMAPERFPGDDNSPPEAPSSPPGDIYSLACVLHQCLTGEIPFEGDVWTLRWKHRHGPRPQPGAEGSPLAAFNGIVARGLAVLPDARPQSAAEFVAGVEDALISWRNRVDRPTPSAPAAMPVPSPAPTPVGDPQPGSDTAPGGPPTRQPLRAPRDEEPVDVGAETRAGPGAGPDEQGQAGIETESGPEPDPDAVSDVEPEVVPGTEDQRAVAPDPAAPRRERPTTVASVMVGGAATGILGAGAVALVGTSAVASGLAIAASWAAGACLGWWYGSRGPT